MSARCNWSDPCGSALCSSSAPATQATLASLQAFSECQTRPHTRLKFSTPRELAGHLSVGGPPLSGTAVFRQALKWHPDKNRDDPKKAEARFKSVSEAYEVMLTQSMGTLSAMLLHVPGHSVLMFVRVGTHRRRLCSVLMNSSRPVKLVVRRCLAPSRS